MKKEEDPDVKEVDGEKEDEDDSSEEKKD
jgi:hypothetical protein